MLRRFWAFVAAALVALLVAVLTLGLVAPASAATSDVPPPPGSSPAYRYGIAPSTLAACTSLSGGDIEERAYGGWSGNTVIANYRGFPSPPVLAERPMAITISEPCYEAAAGHPSQTIRTRALLTQLAYTYGGTITPGGAGAVQPCNPANTGVDHGCGAMSGGVLIGVPVSYTDWYIVCQDAAWSTTQTTLYSGRRPGFNSQGLQLGVSEGAYVTQTLRSDLIVSYSTSPNSTSGPYSCPYLVELHMVILLDTDVGPQREARGITWRAYDWATDEPYAAQSTVGQKLCAAVNWVNPECYAVDPTRVDPMDYDVMCAGGPLLGFDWADWSASLEWLPALIGHHAKCLFMPVAGFDRGGWVADAWADGVAGEVAAAASTAAAAFQWGETCGVLINGGGVFEGFVLDTCSWASWATPIKTVLSWGIIAFAAVWLISFVVRTIGGVVNRKSPTPLDDGAAS